MYEGLDLNDATWDGLRAVGYKDTNTSRTQIKSTVNTYKNYEQSVCMLQKGQKLLDYGSGLGHGSAFLYDAGYNVESFEPYYNSEKGVFCPHHTDSQDLKSEEYDMVINHAVLNVVPRVTREYILRNIFRVLKMNGVAYISAMGWNNIKERFKQKDALVVGPREIVTKTGTFQKGYTQKEFELYVQSVLPGCNVEKSGYGDIGVRIVKKKRLQEV